MARSLLFLVGVVACAQNALAVWPLPTTYQTGTEAVKLSSGFSISYAKGLKPPSDLALAVSRTESFIKTDKLERLVVGRSSADASKLGKAKSLTKLTLHLTSTGPVKSIAQEAVYALDAREESYTLSVPAGGEATITANSTMGLFRGLTTFQQLWYTSGNTIYSVEAPISITDKPVYPYRGFMLDTSRNYYPVADIKRMLDSMALVKQNTFHWHVVDSQSFPLVVKKFPELSAQGAYSSGQVYTPADVQSLVTYAGQRGIDVILEIDTPGHTSAISKSHPAFIACPDAAPWTSFANEPPAGQLRLTSPAVLTFVQELFSSVLEDLPGKYFNTGGDEINDNCYTQDNQTQADLVKNGQTFEQALSHFVQVSHSAVRKEGKIPVVWEELVLAHNVTLGNDTLVMVWISSENVGGVVEAGFQVIHAASDFFYLDCGGGGWVGNNTLGNSWCDPFKTWQKSYSFDPLANVTAANAHLIKGGQSLLWSEQSDSSNVDSQVWPRAAASAEVFWSGGGGNVETALPRLHDLRYRLVQRGVRAIALQPEFCAIRPGECDL